MKARQIIIILFSILLAIVLYLITGIFIATNNKAKVNKSDNDTITLTKVKAAAFSNKSSALTVYSFGQVTSSALINISAEVSGIINSNIILKKGTSFSKGQTLLTIRNEDMKLALQARKSNYLTILTNILPDLKLDYPNSFIKWQDFYTNLDPNKPLPELPEVKDFKEKNFLSSRNIFTEYYSIKSDEERLKKYTIIAPFSGSIINAMTDDGAVVNPGTPIITILRDGNLEIELPINKNEISQVKKGAAVMLYDENNISAKGKVVRIGNYINPQTQTIPVFIDIIESNQPLYNGVYLNAEIAAEGFDTVMELPRKALIDKSSIFIVQDSKLQKLEITIVSFQKSTFFARGIPDSSIVVIEPVINGKDGVDVEIIKTSK